MAGEHKTELQDDPDAAEVVAGDDMLNYAGDGILEIQRMALRLGEGEIALKLQEAYLVTLRRKEERARKPQKGR